MLFIRCAFLLFCASDWTRAIPELVWLEDLNNDHHLRHLEMGLPNHLEFNLKRQGGNELRLRLEENVRLNANAPVYEAVIENGKHIARQLDVPPIIGTKFYQDKRTGTAVKVTCTNQPFGACQRVLEGSLTIDGDNYEIKPSPSMLKARGMGSQTDAPHLIEKVEPPLEPQPGDRVRGLYGADSKRITANKDGASEHDHKTVPDSIPELPEVTGLPERNLKSIPGKLKMAGDPKTIWMQREIDALSDELPEPNVQQDLIDELRELLKEEELEGDLKDMFIDEKRQRRAEGDMYAVEIVIVIDPALWRKYYAMTEGNNKIEKDKDTEYYIRERLAHIINGVSLRYESIEDKDMNVYVTISEFLFYKTDTLLSQSIGIQTVNGVEYADSDKYIDGLPSWASGAPITRHNDHIMVITGYELYYGGKTGNDGVAGVAFVGGACGSYRTSVQEDGDYFVLTSVAAHELGHNLGAVHDGQGTSKNCNKKDKYIMAPFVASFSSGERYSLNPWRFSDCSIQAFKRFFGSGRCFLDHGDYYNKDEWDKHNKLQPGERSSPDEQCKLIKGENSHWCSSFSDDICRYMTCYDSQDGYCYYYAAARGTTCGQSMWCIDGQCVKKDVIVTTAEAPQTTTTTPSTTKTEQPRTTTATTTTEEPRSTTTQAPSSTTSFSECVDIGWYNWSCQRVSDYFYRKYSYRPSYWCQDPYWAKACCEFCIEDMGSTAATTMAPTTVEPCVDRGYYSWTCKRISKFFWRQYRYRPKEWCTDPEWKYNCCEYCAARGY